MSGPRQERFRGKTVLVTGAAQGIGEAIARTLVAEGAFVYAMDRKRERLELLGAELSREAAAVEPVAVDIRDGATVAAAIQQIDARRAIDGLVNAAGVLIPSPFTATTDEAWLETFATNVRGTFLVSRVVAGLMSNRNSGAIVTIASNAGRTPRVNLSAYCASKAAVAMLTKCMGLELGKHGVRCNIVSPGSTNTAMLRALADDSDDQRRRLIEGESSLYRTGIPLGRVAEPPDVALAVAFLLSDDARHITMQDLVVDGGASF